MSVTKEVVIGSCRLVLADVRDVAIEPVDAVITDPPYGMTANKWDVDFALDWVWSLQAEVYVMTASQPFTSKLVMAQQKWFKHEWIWIKNRGSNFANTVREPMKEHESVLVFAPGPWTYNKQMQDRTGGGASRVAYDFNFKTETSNYGAFSGLSDASLPKQRVPSSWQKFNCEVGYHPTQKPVPLFEYLIKTYTNHGNTVCDPFMGSGTTGVACVLTGRKFIGVEVNERYFEAACERILKASEAREDMREPSLFGGDLRP